MQFKGFTEKANTALRAALEAAQMMGHTYVGTEHLVLGLLREGTGVAASVLGSQGITADQYQAKIMEVENSGQYTHLSPSDFTPRTKKAMQMALTEAGMMQTYAGTEHLLLAILRDESSVAVRLLTALGARPNELIAQIAHTLGADLPDTGTVGVSHQAGKPGASGGKTPTLDQFGAI